MKTKFLIACCVLSAASANAQESILTDAKPAYVDRLVAVAREKYPRFKLTATRVEAARIGISRAKLSWLDFLQVSYLYTPQFTRQENTNPYFANGYQLGFFMNVGTIIQKPAVIRLARTEYTAATLEKSAADLNIETQVRQRYYTYLKQLNLLKLRTNMLGDAGDLLKGLKLKFERGQVTFESYNQAQISYSSQAEDKITAEADMLIAQSNLEELLGEKLENIH